MLQCILSTNITNNCFYFKISWSLSHPRGFRTLTLSSETSAGVAVWNEEERKMWPDGEIVGYGLALTLILGVCNENTVAVSACFESVCQKQSVNSFKGWISPWKNGKVELSLLAKPAT